MSLLGEFVARPHSFLRYYCVSTCKTLGAGRVQELATEGMLDKVEWPAVYKKRYASSWWYHTKLCFSKKLMLLLRDGPYIRSQIGSSVVMGEWLRLGRREAFTASVYSLLSLSHGTHLAHERGCSEGRLGSSFGQRRVGMFVFAMAFVASLVPRVVSSSKVSTSQGRRQLFLCVYVRFRHDGNARHSQTTVHGVSIPVVFCIDSGP